MFKSSDLPYESVEGYNSIYFTGLLWRLNKNTNVRDRSVKIMTKIR